MKPLFKTKIGLILKSLVIRNIPLVGAIVENLDSEDGGKGVLRVDKLAHEIARLIVSVVTIIQIIKSI